MCRPPASQSGTKHKLLRDDNVSEAERGAESSFANQPAVKKQHLEDNACQQQPYQGLLLKVPKHGQGSVPDDGEHGGRTPESGHHLHTPSSGRSSSTPSTGLDEFEDAVTHWKAQEARYHGPHSKIWETQQQVSPHLRRVLVDWLLDVTDSMKLMRETFFLAVNYIDRYLGCAQLQSSELPLLGITCLWMAAKFEEVHGPKARMFACHITSDIAAGTKSLCEMELKVLTAVNFELASPTAFKFLGYFWKAADVKSLQVNMLAVHLLELTTLATADYLPISIRAPSLMPTPANVSAVQMSSEITCTSTVCTAVGRSPAAVDFVPTDKVPPTAALSPVSPHTPCQSNAPKPHHHPVEMMAVRSLHQACNSVFSCLANAMPSHIAAAALLSSLMVNLQHTPMDSLATLAQLAQCQEGHLLQLAQAMQQLWLSLSSSPKPCVMVQRYQDRAKAVCQHLPKQALGKST